MPATATGSAPENASGLTMDPRATAHFASHVKRVPPVDPGHVVNVVANDSVMLVKAGAVADILDSRIAMKFEQPCGHARNIGDAAETQLGVKVLAGRVRQAVRMGSIEPKPRLVNEIGTEDVRLSERQHLAVRQHIASGGEE